MRSIWWFWAPMSGCRAWDAFARICCFTQYVVVFRSHERLLCLGRFCKDLLLYAVFGGFRLPWEAIVLGTLWQGFAAIRIISSQQKLNSGMLSLKTFRTRYYTSHFVRDNKYCSIYKQLGHSKIQLSFCLVVSREYYIFQRLYREIWK